MTAMRNRNHISTKIAIFYFNFALYNIKCDEKNLRTLRCFVVILVIGLIIRGSRIACHPGGFPYLIRTPA